MKKHEIKTLKRNYHKYLKNQKGRTKKKKAQKSGEI